MIIKLLLILSLFYGLTIHSKTDYESNSGFDSLEELGDFFNNSWKHFEIKGETNPKHLMEKIDNCLLSVNVETDSSIKLVFVDKETIQKVYENRVNIDIENLPKGFLCHGVASGAKIVKIGDKFLFDSDGHHVSISLELLEVNKKQAVFQYINGGFFGFMNYSSSETGALNLDLN